MNNYLTNINTLEDYNKFIASNDCPYVNVSNIYYTDEVKYFKDDTVDQNPFTIEILSIPQSASYIELWLPTIFNEGDCFDYRIKHVSESDYSEWVRSTGPEHYADATIHEQLVVGDKIQIITDGRGLYDIGMWPNGEYDQQDRDDLNNQLSLSGNIMSIFEGYKYKIDPIPTNENYNKEQDLWYDSTSPLCWVEDRVRLSVVDISNLWLPTRCLPRFVFHEMFKNFERITTAPQIYMYEATHCSTYDMFLHCVSLTTASDITIHKITGEYALQYMFSECTSLVTGPNITVVDPIINNGNAFFDMFINCTSLERITLPAVIGGNNYQIAPGCTSLTEITNLANQPWIIWADMSDPNEAPQTGTLYYRDYGAEMAYDPSSMVPAGWTCVPLQENNQG